MKEKTVIKKAVKAIRSNVPRSEDDNDAQVLVQGSKIKVNADPEEISSWREEEAEKLKEALDADENTSKQNKLHAALIGTGILPLIGTVIGFIVGFFQESEEREAGKRNIVKKLASGAYDKAKALFEEGKGVTAEQLKNYAYDKAHAEKLAEREVSHRTTWSALIGGVFGFGLVTAAIAWAYNWYEIGQYKKEAKTEGDKAVTTETSRIQEWQKTHVRQPEKGAGQEQGTVQQPQPNGALENILSDMHKKIDKEGQQQSEPPILGPHTSQLEEKRKETGTGSGITAPG